jgi:RHH-type transcriptional regulator, rel operon repressor / antitoxin RelB
MGILVNLSKETEARAERLALKSGLAKQDLLQAIVEQGLEDAEDYFSASERLEAVKAGKETVFSSIEARRQLGLDS